MRIKRKKKRSSLATIHRLRNVLNENFSNYIVKTIILQYLIRALPVPDQSSVST
jgi:hypothetical protein